MGSPLSNSWRCAGKTAIGLDVVASQEPTSHDNQVDAMVCDPAMSIPSNSTCIAGGDQENCKEPANSGAAPGEKNAGWLPAGSGMFTNVVDGRLQSDIGFPDLVSFLQRFPAAEEFRNFFLTVIVKFLEERLSLLSKASSEQIAKCYAFYQSEVTMLTVAHEQQVTDIEARSQDMIMELSRNHQKVSEELSDAQTLLKTTNSELNSAQSELLDCKKTVHSMQARLKEAEAKQKQELNKLHDSIEKNMNAQRAKFEVTLRHSEETGHAEVHRLNAVIDEKVKAFGSMEAVTSRLRTECQKLKAELATFEKKSAQESLTSGSYADGHVNPSMLETACKALDKATDSIVRFLQGNSITGKLSHKSPQLESFIGKLSPARPADFSRPGQVKHVWGHWICAIMFQSFEHVFFDVGEARTSPLDFKRHALECFQSFQQNKDVAAMDYYKTCVMFREFCIKTYSLLFPLKLVNEGLQLDSMQLVAHGRDGRFSGDEELYLLFLDIAKAIWLLHKLSFSFDPPACILRMGRGTPFDKQYHEPLIKDADNAEMSLMVVLMIRPAFRIRNTTVKSRVLLSKASA